MNVKNPQISDFGQLDEKGVAAIERAIGRSVADGIESFMTDPKRVAKVVDAMVEVATSRGAEESGRWLWRKLAGFAWGVAKWLALVACILYFGGGWPAVLAFFKLKAGN